MNHEEIELISRCQQGDQTALEEIFNQYHKKVYRIAYHSPSALFSAASFWRI